MNDHGMAHLRDDDVVLDDMPESLQKSLDERRRFLASLPPDSGGLEFKIADLRRWRPGENVTVAFLGGDSTLHREIVEATQAITSVCSLTLDFGYDETTGSYRTWS